MPAINLRDLDQLTPTEESNRGMQRLIGEASDLIQHMASRVRYRALRAARDEQENYGAEDWRNDEFDEAVDAPDWLP